MTKNLDKFLDAERLHTKIYRKTVDELVAFVKRNQDKRPLDVFADFRDNVEPWFSTFYASAKNRAILKEKLDANE